MFDQVDKLREAVDALAAIDVDTLDDDGLDGLVVALGRQSHRLAAATAGLLSCWERRGLWATDGSRSAACRLARDTATSPGTAKVALRRARALSSMPAVAAAVGEGRLSMDHVDLLARADRPACHDLLVRDEQLLVDQLAGLRYAQGVKLVDYWRLRADAEGVDDEARRQVDGAYLHASTMLGGSVRLDGELDPVGGQIVTGELGRLEHQLYLQDQRDGVARSVAQRRAAALVEMAARSAAAPGDVRRARPLFTVVVGDDSLARLCELAAGTVIAPGLLVPYLGAAEIETVLFDGPATILSVSPRRRFTGCLRRAIEVRDRHCQHPSGCDIAAPDCDIDHTVPVAAGGATTQFNGRLECRPHNRDTTKHDHHTTPTHPDRPVDILHHIRARLRWRLLHDPDDDGDEPAA